MFGRLGASVNGNVFLCLFDGDLVFKLSGEAHTGALKLKSAALWDPGSMGRPMKEWVRIPAIHQEKFKQLAAASLQYVETLPAKKKA